MNKEEKFLEELYELCSRYMDDFGIVMVIKTNNKDIHITGNFCAVCAKEYLEKHIEIKKLKHNNHLKDNFGMN